MACPLVRRLLAPLCLAACVAGCGDPPPELHPVEGTVRLGSKPLAGVNVSFLPETAKGEANYRRSSGMTDANGKYTLTYEDPITAVPGAVVGKHVVLVNDPEMENLDNPDRFKRPQIAVRYKKVIETPLTFEVKPGPQTIDIEVTGR